MHIAIDCRMYYASGIGTYLRNLVPFLISLRPDITFSLLGDTNILGGFSWVNNENVLLVDCRVPIYSIAEQHILFRKIPNCDIFFTPHYNVPVMYRGMLITTIHDIFHLAEENESKTLLKTAYARTMLTMALKKSKIVMTDSQFTLDEMHKYKLPYLDKVRVVPLGFGLENSDIHYLPNLSGKGYLLYVGNVKPHKNLRRLISAYKLLHKENRINIPLIIVGEERKFITGMPELKKEIMNSEWKKWIEFTGWINDAELKNYYLHATALVQPSIYEGFGLPALEAMYFGRPVIASKVASLPEVCGDAALYCNPYNIQDIANKMYNVIVDDRLRKQLIERGYQQIKKYSWEKTAKSVLRAIEEVSRQ